MTFHTIQFCIDASKFLPTSKIKKSAFSALVPGIQSTYIYTDESSYMNQYAMSFYGLTCRKAGWDCFRHYEIIAAGAIPYFDNLEDCPSNIMTLFPKEMVLAAMRLPGVDRETLSIDFSIFPIDKYFILRDQIYRHALTYLTTEACARRVLQTMHITTPLLKPILFLSEPRALEDYQAALLLTGLKHIGGPFIVDSPRLRYLYNGASSGVGKSFYGGGFNYTSILPNQVGEEISHDSISQRIRDRDFSLIIYSNIHRAVPFWDIVQANYSKNEIAFICGEDSHPLTCIKRFTPHGQLFIREASP